MAPEQIVAPQAAQEQLQQASPSKRVAPVRKGKSVARPPAPKSLMKVAMAAGVRLADADSESPSDLSKAFQASLFARADALARAWALRDQVATVEPSTPSPADVLLPHGLQGTWSSAEHQNDRAPGSKRPRVLAMLEEGRSELMPLQKADGEGVPSDVEAGGNANGLWAFVVEASRGKGVKNYVKARGWLASSLQPAEKPAGLGRLAIPIAPACFEEARRVLGEGRTPELDPVLQLKRIASGAWHAAVKKRPRPKKPGASWPNGPGSKGGGLCTSSLPAAAVARVVECPPSMETSCLDAPPLSESEIEVEERRREKRRRTKAAAAAACRERSKQSMDKLHAERERLWRSIEEIKMARAHAVLDEAARMTSAILASISEERGKELDSWLRGSRLSQVRRRAELREPAHSLSSPDRLLAISSPLSPPSIPH